MKNKKNESNRFITIKQRNTIELLDIAKITHLVCSSYITTIYQVNADPLVVSKLLKDFENELTNSGFLRANRSALINMAYVKKFTGGSIRTIELTNGEIVSISRRNVYKFKEYLSA